MTHDNIDVVWWWMMTLATALFLQALLRGWGYNVALANSGRQALEQVQEQVFDLVLCTMARMAEMDSIAMPKRSALNRQFRC